MPPSSQEGQASKLGNFLFSRGSLFKPSLHNHRAQDILGLVHLGFGPEGASSSLLAGEASG